MPDHDTIVAIGTAAGESALGVVRLSGPLSSKIMDWHASCLDQIVRMDRMELSSP